MSYYTGDDVGLVVVATLNGNSASLVSATCTVWLPNGTKTVDAAVATISGSRASYLLAGSKTATAGIYTYGFSCVFPGGYGTLSIKNTLTVEVF